ncbi:hypothetical protein VC83_02082 [Pseudogymnoascus destructans]|uniref:Membrane-bound alpha-1,6-mannosyltransferase Initiation-specific n=1 Tax=Pseudogymnoascus destructans TaxID=655981 RepID=A0A177AGN7_9PEZI|nr:uncharacterized protein VC83_02082 [Pseudogymnoascus destructans]OAF61289.2 hypothetical protein VC83_02082 [Pseudogymnoascus destructans]
MPNLFRFGLRALAFFLFICLAFRIAFFVHLFSDHAGIALTQEEVAQAHHAVTDDVKRRPTIPRIIHQIFHNWTDPNNEALPSDWKETRQTCLDFNENWENRLWTEKTSREFLAEEYPWFLPTYDKFKYPVQKIDALRYFAIRHFGGIYIDLDNGCTASLEPLRYYPAWVTDGGCGALSNNILGGEANHPYWVLMTESIISYAWNYPLPYLTISYATGQWFETEIWEKYHRQLPKDKPVLARIIMDGRPGASPWVFFTQTRGGTWDNWDNLLFKWIGDNLVITSLVIIGFVASIAVTAIGVVRSAKGLWENRKGYTRLGDLSHKSHSRDS